MQAPVATSPANFKSPEVRLSTPADTLKKRKESSKPGHVGLSNATKAVPVRKVLRGRVASREEASKGRATVQQSKSKPPRRPNNDDLPLNAEIETEHLPTNFSQEPEFVAGEESIEPSEPVVQKEPAMARRQRMQARSMH